MTDTPHILLTGATGYVGGRLLKRLEMLGYRVRCMARRPEYLKPRVSSGTEVVQGDALDIDSLEGVFDGIDVAYYMIHSMGGSGSFEQADREAAQNFSQQAKRAGVKRIIYLGGLADDSEELSSHLKSRQETGHVLAEAGVQLIEFRASIVIGPGSLSFEMIRALVQKLPVMTTPKWVYVEAQPIAVSDLLEYLIQGLTVEVAGNKIFEVGGAERVSYADLMQEYARQRGLKRRIIPVPMLTPYISSLWLGLVTPLFARVGKKLIDSLCHRTVVQDFSAKEYFSVKPKGFVEAVEEALKRDDEEFALTRWSDSMAVGDTYRKWGGARFGTRLVDARSKIVKTNPKKAFGPIQRIGGLQGWYYANFLWRIRGFIDLLCGGVGMRRGRRDQEQIVVGDVLDCWRVEHFEQDKILRLQAEMKLPGRAWLELEVKQCEEGVKIYQTAIFDPLGLGGLLYWYGVYPLHQLIFAGMLNELVKRGEA